jgi:hypothetical protein
MSKNLTWNNAASGLIVITIISVFGVGLSQAKIVIAQQQQQQQ